jgi:hypothetical protein
MCIYVGFSHTVAQLAGLCADTHIGIMTVRRQMLKQLPSIADQQRTSADTLPLMVDHHWRCTQCQNACACQAVVLACTYR